MASSGVKPALKRNPSEKNKQPIVWNEENLEYNEANKSATMKIDEPKTPYHAPIPDGGEGMDVPGGEGDDFFRSGGLDGGLDDPAGPRQEEEPDHVEEPAAVPAPASQAPVAVAEVDMDLPSLALPGIKPINPLGGDDDDGVEVELTEEEKEAKKREFAKARKAHYNEAEMLARARALMAEEDDENDDDE